MALLKLINKQKITNYSKAECCMSSRFFGNAVLGTVR